MAYVSYIATAFGAYTLLKQSRPVEIWQPSFRTADVSGGRTHGVIDGWGTAAAPLEPGTIDIPFAISGTAATVRAAELSLGTALSQGRQRLYFNPESAGIGPQLFTDARPSRMRRNLRRGNIQTHADFAVTFYLPVYRLMQALTEALVETYAVTSNGVEVAENVFGESWTERWFGTYTNPTTLTINNPGNLRCPLIIRIDSAGAGGYANPSIANAATGQSVTVNRTAAGAASILQINTELDAGGVRESTDSGASLVDLGYGDATTNAWDDVVLPNNQGPILELAPGANVITVTGVSNGTVGFLWHPWYLL